MKLSKHEPGEYSLVITVPERSPELFMTGCTKHLVVTTGQEKMTTNIIKAFATVLVLAQVGTAQGHCKEFDIEKHHPDDPTILISRKKFRFNGIQNTLFEIFIFCPKIQL